MESSHRLKLDQAVEHLYALEAACQRWTQTDACSVREQCEIETRKHLLFVDVISQPTDPLIPLRMGDCIHNMRQALDHLAYRLAISSYRQDPPPNEENTGFPITTTPAHFNNAVYGKIAAKKFLPKGVHAALEMVQPHPGRPQHLWLLHELDNLDKHRFPPVVAGVAAAERFDIGHFQGSHFVGPRLGVLDADTPVLEYIPAPGTQLHMQLHFAGAVSLAKTSTIAPGEAVLPLLSGIRNFILREVFAPLEEFL